MSNLSEDPAHLKVDPLKMNLCNLNFTKSYDKCKKEHVEQQKQESYNNVDLELQK